LGPDFREKNLNLPHNPSEAAQCRVKVINGEYDLHMSKRHPVWRRELMLQSVCLLLEVFHS
jgi:hypothetical protein